MVGQGASECHASARSGGTVIVMVGFLIGVFVYVVVGVVMEWRHQ